MMQRCRRFTFPFLCLPVFCGALLLRNTQASAPAAMPLVETIQISQPWQREFELKEGLLFSLSVHLPKPTALPENGALRVSWVGPRHRWQKTLHAFDTDVYVLCRALETGCHMLTIAPSPGETLPEPSFAHDRGTARLGIRPPEKTPWPTGLAVPVRIEVTPFDPIFNRCSIHGALVESEPNDSAAQANELPIEPDDGDRTIVVFGGADDLEYFNNQRVGTGDGDDWYQLVYRGTRPKLLTANLQLVEPIVSARIRCYTRDGKDGSRVTEYLEGRDLNEKPHQQDDNYRTFITRTLQPGETYYLRVEANQPGYELEVRLVDLGPFDDPIRTIRQGMYYHLAEVDAWLIHRPRNIAAFQRVRDGTNLFGENCMSCHTQSGVWGVAEAAANGHRFPPGTMMNWRRLVNTMYECARPTNHLVDACVNTSLPPNDLGDGPAGTRVAGRNMVLAERFQRPKKLHAYQHIRAANYVLQTTDPGGINAAGRGSNYGPIVVYKFASEILRRAWDDTGDPKYLLGLEDKARKALDPANEKKNNAVLDDLGHRLELICRVWPADYLDRVKALANDPRYRGQRSAAQALADAEELHAQLLAQAKLDQQRLIDLQLPDGGWNYDLTREQKSTDAKGSRTNTPNRSEPPRSATAPTAVALIGLQAAGLTKDHPAVQRGIQALCRQQTPYGLWNQDAITGFVTTAYALRALGLLHPVTPEPIDRRSFVAPPSLEPRVSRILRARHLATTNDTKLVDLMLAVAGSDDPQERYYGLIGLGGVLAPEGLPVILRSLNHPVKMVREAAFWALRQLLLDDIGWDETFDAFARGDDLTRESVLHALLIRADAVGPKSRIHFDRLNDLFDQAFRDPHPAVRAAAFKAAWHWWIWNPPTRARLNAAWVDALLRPEPSYLAEHALRYSTHSLLIANGHIANQTGSAGNDGKQQYAELADLYRRLAAARAAADSMTRQRLDRRLAAVAATCYQERGGDGGPGQLGYSTPGAGDAIGTAVLAVLDQGDPLWTQIALEAAANVPHASLQQRLIGLIRDGVAETVGPAARALSNPQSVSLDAEPEQMSRLVRRLVEFHTRADGKDHADALSGVLSRVRWRFAERLSRDEEAAFFRALYSAVELAPADARLWLADALGKVLANNRDLHRAAVFSLVPEEADASRRHFWVLNTDWMLSFRSGSELANQQALEGAIEGETMKVLKLTFGRTTETLLGDGLASKNKVLWWREGKPGERLTLALPAPEAGRYDLTAGFILDKDYATVQLYLNGRKLGDVRDLYRPYLTATGPVSLGVYELKAGENELEIEIVGANPAAEKNYVFALDYVVLTKDVIRGLEVQRNEQGRRMLDPFASARQRLAQMYVAALSADAPALTREQAFKLANQTAIRRNPEIRTALAAALPTVKEAKTRETLQRILGDDDAAFRKDLDAALQEEAARLGQPAMPLTSEQFSDIVFFRDHVWAELNRLKREDQRSCLSCHGVPGRVPTLYLDPPDPTGYIEPAKLLANYRRLQGQIDVQNPQQSKLLRKPLNIQTGEEDGHQGGARYTADDPRYQVLVQWVRNQVRLRGAAR
ncbi:MAG: hypothetical protein NZ700_09885 [Gemmataceae bacterium]|nr:hypothetical protein [Gemmataceae bacterium]MDW8264890.1 hypothetical protein [Gemmataceae bacterium]